jgi:hypothetical protein
VTIRSVAPARPSGVLRAVLPAPIPSSSRHVPAVTPVVASMVGIDAGGAFRGVPPLRGAFHVAVAILCTAGVLYLARRVRLVWIVLRRGRRPRGTPALRYRTYAHYAIRRVR